MPEIPVAKKYERTRIKSINIIDIKTGNILFNRDVLIEGNLIRSIDTAQLNKKDEGILVVEGKGKFLMPGLWDMHTHSTQHSEWLHHPLYIANGVTAIRDMSGQMGKADSYWAGTKDRKSWNRKLDSHKQVTPRYVLHSSYQINGSNSVPYGFPEYFKMEKEEDVPLLLAHYQKEGTNFIKVYSEIPAKSYRKLIKESPSYNIHIAGHKPLNISLEEAITSGQRSFEHGRIYMFDCFPEADSLMKTNNKGSFFRNSMRSMVTDFDRAKAERLMGLMREHDAYWTPTLQTVKMSAFADREEFLSNPHLVYISAMRKTLWWNPDINRSAKDNRSSERKELNMQYYEAVKEQVGMAHKNGVRIMTGTDVTDSYSFPGFSLHAELADLAKCGISNLEVLQAATIVPAQYSHLENRLGSVEMGKLADLIILSENPLVDIANTEKITGVILNGTYYDEDALKNLKEITRDLASSFHLNIKFLYSLFSSPLMRKQFAD